MTIYYGTDKSEDLDILMRYDEVWGYDGDDTIYSYRDGWYVNAGGPDGGYRLSSGDDTVYAGEGDDSVSGGGGDDELWGEEGADTLLGGIGDDYLWSYHGDDSLRGNEGNDTLFGGDGKDTLYGDEGDDELIAGAGNDVLYGYHGHDLLWGEGGDDTIEGSRGNDTYIGGEGNDLLIASNIYYGGFVLDDSSAYFFNLGDGHDTISDNGGNDYIQFGEGIFPSDVRFATGADEETKNDVILFINDDSITIKNQLDNVSAIEAVYFEDGTIYSVEDIIALANSEKSTNGDDLIFGTDSDDILFGLGGNDTIIADTAKFGSDGNDVISGDAGDDSIIGGNGDDTFSGGRGNDYIEGGRGNNIYLYNVGDGHDTIKGGFDNVNRQEEVLQFGAGISQENITYETNSELGGVTINFRGTSEDSIKLSYFAVETLLFDDGTSLGVSDLWPALRYDRDNPHSSGIVLRSELLPGESAQRTYVPDNDSETNQPLAILKAYGGLLKDDYTQSRTTNLLAFSSKPEESAKEGFDYTISHAAGINGRSSVSVQPLDVDTLIGWQDIKAQSKPSLLSDDAWDLTFKNFTTSVGSTVGELSTRLAASPAGTQSALFGLSYEMQKAGDFGSLEHRNMSGSLGEGWAFLGDIGLNINNDGTVQLSGTSVLSGLFGLNAQNAAYYTISSSTNQAISLNGSSITAPDGLMTFAQRDNGAFVGVNTESVLSKQPDGYHITLSDDTLLHFNHDGQFLSAQSGIGGHEVTAFYDRFDKLSALQHNTYDAGLSFHYNGRGNVTHITDRFGQRLDMEYNFDEQLIQVDSRNLDSGETNLIIGSSHFEYDAQGDLTKATNPDNVVTDYAYDAAGRLIELSVADDALSLSYVYDDNSYTVTDGTGRQNTVSLLINGVAESYINGQGETTELLFNDAREFEGIQFSDGRILALDYDEQGRLTSKTAPDQSSILYGYSGEDRLINSITDASGNQRLYDYNDNQLLTRAEWGDDTAKIFTYDNAGNVIESANRKGDITYYSYDAANRLTAQSDSAVGAISYAYDAFGRLITASTDSGITSINYDAAGNIANIIYPNGHSLSYEYSAAGKRTSMTNHDGDKTEYSYDVAGRLEALYLNGELITSYQYDKGGKLVEKTHGNGQTTLYEYDNAGRLTLIEQRSAADILTSQERYTHNEEGIITSKEDATGLWEYEYDEQGQLTSANFTSLQSDIEDISLNYTYDASGNRTSTMQDEDITSYDVSALNRYTQAGDVSYIYDADGNIIQATDDNGTTSYSYNSFNRLTSVTDAQGSVLEYEYNVFGHRSAIIRDGERTELLVDPFGLGNVVADYDGNGEMLHHYHHGLMLESRHDISGDAYYYHSDNVGSVTNITDRNGDVVNYYGYTPFGDELFERETIANNFEFNGAFGITEDAEDMHYMRARNYDVTTGRFNGEDPLFIAGDEANLYRFAANAPTGFLDPTGNRVWTWGGTVDAVNGSGGGGEGGFYHDTSSSSGNHSGFYSTTEYGAGVDTGLSLEVSVYKDLASFNAPTVNASFQVGFYEITDHYNYQGEFVGRSQGLGSWGWGAKVTVSSGLSISGADLYNNIMDDWEGKSGQGEDRSATEDPGTSGASKGEPHLTTFDGLGYSFQGVGEYVLARGEGFEVQVRYEYVRPDVGLSVATAIAMQIGDDVVSMYTDLGKSVSLFINDQPLSLRSSFSLAVGDGSLNFNEHRRTITVVNEYGDGFDAYIYGPPYGIRTMFTEIIPFVREGGTDGIEGLLGNANNDQLDDLQLADGTLLSTDNIPSDILYGAFADTWRISPESRLFNDDVKKFDVNVEPLTLERLDPELVAWATNIVRQAGIEEGTFDFESAVFDVAALEDPNLADVYVPDTAPVESENNGEQFAPDAQDDNISTLENNPVIIDVLANDSDRNGDTLSVVNAENPVRGTIIINEDNTILYTPIDGFSGTDSFTYEISDGTTNATATVRITIDAIDRAEGQALTGDSQGNTLFGDVGNDTIDGGRGSDDLLGRAGDDVLEGSYGDDALAGEIGNDTLNGGTGNDLLSGGEDHDVLSGRNGNDRLNGGSGDDTLYGGNGTDNIQGDDGNDILYGGDDSDIMHGGEGADILIGGNGADILTGGSGADIFRFVSYKNSHANKGSDSITDFDASNDIIDLEALGYIGITSNNAQKGELLLTYDEESQHTVISDNHSDFVITLEGGDLRTLLSDDDFIF